MNEIKDKCLKATVLIVKKMNHLVNLQLLYLDVYFAKTTLPELLQSSWYQLYLCDPDSYQLDYILRRVFILDTPYSSTYIRWAISQTYYFPIRIITIIWYALYYSLYGWYRLDILPHSICHLHKTLRNFYCKVLIML